MPVMDLKKQERNIEIEVLKSIKDDLTQKRCYVAELVRKGLNKYIDYDDLVTDSTYSIYKLPIVNEELSIIDFEINSLSVHVIPTVDKAKNANVYIPSIYKMYSYKPDVLVFVNFTKSFAKMDILGYLTEYSLNDTSLPKTLLSPADNLINVLKAGEKDKQPFATNALETTQELMLAYIENDLSEEGKRFFLKHLISSNEIRKNYKLFYALNCEFISVANAVFIDKAVPFIEEETYSSNEFYAEEEKQDFDEIEEEIEAPKIETFARSNFLIEAQAVPLPEPQEEEPTMGEVNLLEEPEDNTNQEENLLEENNEEELQQEEILEENNEPEALLLEEPTAETAEEIVEEVVEDNIEAKEPVAEVQSIEETDLSITNDGEEFNLLEEGEEELLLEDSEPLENLEENTEELLSQEPVEVESIEEEIVVEDTPNEDEELFDIAEDVSLELLEEEAQPEAAEEEEDLFSFLSDIADDMPATEQPEIEEVVPQEPEYQEMQETTYEQAQYSEPVVQQQYAENQFETTMASTQAFDQGTQPQQQAPGIGFAYGEVQNGVANENPFGVQQEAPKKKSSPAFLAAMVVLALGVGAYNQKDLIMEQIAAFQGGGEVVEEDFVMPPAPAKPAEEEKALEEAKPADASPQKAPDETAKTDNAQAPAKEDSKTTAEKIAKEDDAPPLPAVPKATTVEPPKAKNLNDAIAIALTKDFNGVRISKVSWEISETLASNAEVSRALTMAGRSVKSFLSQDLMAATEPSFNDKVVVGITYRKNGSVAEIVMDASSGSKQIDDIILQTVKSTLNRIQMPELNIDKDKYSAKLIINL